MPLEIHLRDCKLISHFRRIIHRLVSVQVGDELVLCSGYLWEENLPGKYSVLDDELLDKIHESYKAGHLNQGVTLVGGKFYPPSWKTHFVNFATKIKNKSIPVRAYEATRKNWHAKIALRLSCGTPFAGIVGSSNLTGPAYRENYRNWNFEGDVLLWNDDPSCVSILGSDINNNTWGQISLVLNPNVKQPSIQEQLNGLYSRILKQDGLAQIEI